MNFYFYAKCPIASHCNSSCREGTNFQVQVQGGFTTGRLVKMFVETETLRGIENAHEFAATFGVNTLLFDPRTRRAFLNPCSRTYWHFRINIMGNVTLLLGLSHAIFSAVGLFMTSRISAGVVLYMVVQWLFSATSLQLDWLVLRSADVCVLGVNSWVQSFDILIEDAFSAHWTDAEKKEDREFGKQVRKVVRAHHFCNKWLGPGVALIAFCAHYDEVLILIESGSFDLTGIRFSPCILRFLASLAFLSHMYVILCLHARWNVIGIIVIIVYSYLVYAFRKKLRCNFTSTLDHLERTLRAFNTLKLVISIHMNWCSILLVTGLTISLLFCTLALYFCASAAHAADSFLDRGVGFFILVLSGGFATFLFRVFGSLQSSSTKMLCQFKSFDHRASGTEQETKLLKNLMVARRMRKSTRPVKIYIGSCFLADSKSTLIYWNSVFDKAILLLYTFPLH